jgi:hypothetical protein
MARQALREKIDDLIEEYIQLAMDAKAQGDFETAEKTLRWLLEHAPADEDGQKTFDPSIDKAPSKESKSGGPSIRVGIMVGGIEAKALPEPVIDIQHDPDPNA